MVQLELEKIYVLTFIGFEVRENFKIHEITKDIFWNYLPFSYLGGLFNLLILPATAGSTILIDRVLIALCYFLLFLRLKTFKLRIFGWFQVF